MSRGTGAAESKSPDWYLRIVDSAARFYPGDERPPRALHPSMKGPMLRMALLHGKAAWQYGKGQEGPITVANVRAMVEAGSLRACITWPGSWFSDAKLGGGLGLWTLWSAPDGDLSKGHVDLVTLRYPDLQEALVVDRRERAFARSVPDPKTPKKSLKERTDTL